MLKLHTKVLIGVPGGNWDAHFGMCLMTMVTHILTRPMKGVRQIQFSLKNEIGSDLTKMRQAMVDHALHTQCDFLLFIDTDQTFPSNLLYRMLHWKMPIVACNIPIKTIPSTPTARSFNPDHPGGDVVYSDPEKHGLEQVWRVGTGIILLDCELLKKVPWPHFDAGWDHDLKERKGEDWSLLDKIEKHTGELPYIDHDLSREVGHRGVFTVTHDWVGQVVREEVPAEPVVLTP